MNKNIHLNLFKHYSEIGLENNLTRALVITLQNDPLFLNEFFYKITNIALKRLIQLVKAIKKYSKMDVNQK